MRVWLAIYLPEVRMDWVEVALGQAELPGS